LNITFKTITNLRDKLVFQILGCGEMRNKHENI